MTLSKFESLVFENCILEKAAEPAYLFLFFQLIVSFLFYKIYRKNITAK